MNKQFKKIGMALLSAILLLMPVKVHAIKSHNEWKQEALTYPLNDSLIPAGPIQLKWSSLDDDVKNYKVYFDGQLVSTVSDETTMYEVYTTKVSRHSYQIVAVLNDQSEIKSELNEFYVSKKGVAYNRVDLVSNLKASWYYNWGTKPDNKTKTDLEFVPMVWGSGSESSQIKSIEKSGYHTVLGYNEPEGSLNGQSNVSVTTAISKADIFADSRLRVGSPAVEHASDILVSNSWFDKYMKSVDHDDIDFIAVHEYFYNICSCTNRDDTKKVAKEFLTNLSKIYNKYKKPIWITEMGVVNWDPYWQHYSYSNENGKDEVYEFMGYIVNGVDGVKGLNDLSFVERYAWFPFDTSSTTAGASSLFVTETDKKSNSSLKVGQLNKLGKLYRDTGNPSGYGKYINIKRATFKVEDVTYDGTSKEPVLTVTYNNKKLSLNTDYTVKYLNNIDVGEGKIVVEGKGKYRSTKEIYFKINPKDISKLTMSSIQIQKYTGKAIQPTMTIKDGEYILIENQDYTLAYSNNIKVGTDAKITIVGKGNYTGEIEKFFEISKTAQVKPNENANEGTQENSPLTEGVEDTQVDSSNTSQNTQNEITHSNNTNIESDFSLMSICCLIGIVLLIIVVKMRKKSH